MNTLKEICIAAMVKLDLERLSGGDVRRSGIQLYVLAQNVPSRGDEKDVRITYS